MLYKLVLSLAPILIILALSELLWRKNIIKGENSRKFIHILAGVHMAFWPFYVPFDGVFVLSAMALTLVVYSRVTKLFSAIYVVDRRTYGDIFYAVALMVCAYFGTEPWIFTVSILLLGLADGCAAIVGKKWGKRSTYYFFGSKKLKKSLVGSSAFFAITLMSVGVAYFIGGADVILSQSIFYWISFVSAMTLLENFSPYGVDNLLVPVVSILILNSLL